LQYQKEQQLMVFRTVPFVYLFILGTQAVMSVIGVRTVPLYVIKRIGTPSHSVQERNE
jgi:hypothetical protein